MFIIMIVRIASIKMTVLSNFPYIMSFTRAFINLSIKWFLMLIIGKTEKVALLDHRENRSFDERGTVINGEFPSRSI